MKHNRLSAAALAVAVLALIAAAVGGTAMALPGKNVVKKGDIAKNVVTSKQVKNDSLTGNDVKESTLGTVPSATSAATATTAANGAARIHYTGQVGAATTTIFNGGGLVLKATCASATDLQITAESTVDNAAIFADTHDHDGYGNDDDDADNSYPQQGDFDAYQPVRLDDQQMHADDGQGIEINYSNPNGTEVFVKFQNWLAGGVATAPAPCFIGGVAFVS
jgi:hypothetical protein